MGRRPSPPRYKQHGMIPKVERKARPWTVTAVDLAGSVYGTILASAIVLALGYKGGNALVMIAALLVTELIFTFAHAWSEVLTAGAARGRFPSAPDVRSAMLHEWPVLQATWPAILALSLAALGVYSTDTGVNVALVANAAVLFIWGLALARMQGAPTLLAVAAGSLTCALGLVLVILKVLVH